MSYTLNLYNFKKKVNSTKQPPDSTYITNHVDLASGFTLAHPRFKVNVNTLSTLLNCNYMEFEGRYYWIEDIESLRNDVAIITGVPDLLATFKDDIGNYECVISRCNNASYYNIFDIDNIYNPTNYIIGSYEASVATDFTYESTGSTFTMCYYGKAGANAVNVGSISRLENIFNNNGFWDVVNQNIFNPSQYVASLIKLPVQFSDYPGATIQLGNGDPETIDVAYPIDYDTNYNWYKEYTLDLKQFKTNLNYITDYRLIDDRFTNINLWVPFVGNIKVSSSILSHEGSLKISYNIDMVTGQGECVTYFKPSSIDPDATDKKRYILNKSNINVGAQIPLGVSDSAWGSVLSNILNPVEQVKTVIQGFNPRQNTNMVGTCNSSAYEDISKIKISVVQYESDDIGDYRTTKGVPTNKYLKISDVKNYIECYNPSISVKGLDGENEQINNILESGFYYE